MREREYGNEGESTDAAAEGARHSVVSAEHRWRRGHHRCECRWRGLGMTIPCRLSGGEEAGRRWWEGYDDDVAVVESGTAKGYALNDAVYTSILVRLFGGTRRAGDYSITRNQLL